MIWFDVNGNKFEADTPEDACKLTEKRWGEPMAVFGDGNGNYWIEDSYSGSVYAEFWHSEK